VRSSGSGCCASGWCWQPKKGTGGCAPPPPSLRTTTGVWDAAAERRDAQDELHSSAAQARAWAWAGNGDFDADHGLAFDGVRAARLSALGSLVTLVAISY
jgi:hypothetical protein